MIRSIILKYYSKLDKRYLLFPKGLGKTLKIGDVNLFINELDSGGTYYDNRKSYEELSSKLYELVNKDYQPKIFIDIGANYGFISVIMSIKIPSAQIIAIEPSKRLIPYIKSNFKSNNIKKYKIINAVCGEHNNISHTISINPNSSQDNRVIGENTNWKKEEVPMININSVLDDFQNKESVFIKIDTQGYEEKVFKGGEKFLKKNNNWFIKTEFAPAWLESQGTNPNQFLAYLIKNYEAAELPATVPYFTSSINELFFSKIKSDFVDEFVEYVTDLNKNQSGWVDLLVRPKT
jgi:FkbM family methyltransferase